MKHLKKLKPTHLYLISVLIINVGTYFENYPVLQFSILIIGITIFIYGAVIHYKE